MLSHSVSTVDREINSVVLYLYNDRVFQDRWIHMRIFEQTNTTVLLKVLVDVN